MGNVLNQVGSAAANVINYYDTVRKDTDTTENAIRCIGYAAVAITRICGVVTPLLNNLGGRFLDHADLINCVYLFPSINNFTPQGDSANQTNLEKLGIAFFGLVSFECVALQLDQWKFIDLGKIAGSIGSNFSILRPIVRQGPLVLLRTPLAAAYLCFDLHNISKWNAPGNTDQENRQIEIDIVKFTTQLALNVFYLAGYTTTTPLIFGLGMVAFGTGVVSYLHRATCLPQPQAQITPDCQGAEHWLDFASRIAVSTSNFDYFSKFAVGTIDFFRTVELRSAIETVTNHTWVVFNQFEVYSKPFGNVQDTLSEYINLNKAVSLLPKIKQIFDKNVSFIDTYAIVNFVAVTIFETLSWFWSMSDMGKAGALFKACRNGFFVNGLTASVISDSWTMERLIPHAEEKKAKWDHRLEQCTSVAYVRSYFEQKLNNQDASQAKRTRWEQALNHVNSNGYNHNTFRNHIQKKQEDWVQIKAYREQYKEYKYWDRATSFTKIVSLAIDLVVLSKVVEGLSVVIPLVGAQIAAVSLAKQAFATVNLSLGIMTITNLHTKEYVIDKEKTRLKLERRISSIKLDNVR